MNNKFKMNIKITNESLHFHHKGAITYFIEWLKDENVKLC
eukprot:UN12279